MSKNIQLLITGSHGFAGKHFYDFVKGKFKNIILFDKITYAADKKFISKVKLKKHKVVVGDINNINLLKKIIKKKTIIVHFAAESHVDNSFDSSLKFTKNNTLGTHSLLEACRESRFIKKIIIISTDEVYGETTGIPVNEKSFIRPTNPYSASKAGADLIAQTYLRCFKMPICILRANNLYGPFQYIEKIIPAIANAINDPKKNKLKLHGKAKTFRHFLHVNDFARAIYLVIKKSPNGEIYNISGKVKFQIINLVKYMGSLANKNYKQFSRFVKDRPFNDKIYKINSTKIKKIGWKEKKIFSNEIKKIINENLVLK